VGAADTSGDGDGGGGGDGSSALVGFAPPLDWEDVRRGLALEMQFEVVGGLEWFCGKVVDIDHAMEEVCKRDRKGLCVTSPSEVHSILRY
jgi:hypothetical protein